MNRTPDLLITNELLYQLSYTGTGMTLERNCFYSSRFLNSLHCLAHNYAMAKNYFRSVSPQ